MKAQSRILVVHESKESRGLLRNALELQSYQVVDGYTGKDAEKILAQESVDLIITSLTLPKDSSVKFVNNVRSFKSKIPIILITNKRRVEAIKECSEIGGDGFISYPLNEETIINTAKSILGPSEKRLAYGDKQGIYANKRCLAGYNLKGVLGKGSMGIVYLAEKIDGDSEKPYAVKVLQKPVGRDEDQKREILERFLREADAASNLIHPNIVRILDFGLAEEEHLPYIVMDFIPGRSLRRFIGESGLNYIQKAMIIRQVAYALTAIHAHGVCHRDIKPENIIMDQRLNVKVTDFGVARLPNSDLTQVVKILGTPAYMAPEAFLSARVDHRADMFSLGVVAYELLLGKKPFYSKTISGYKRVILNDRPIEPKKLDDTFPLELQCILAKSLKKRPEARFKSATDIVVALDGFLDWASNKVDTTVVDLVEYFDTQDHPIDPDVKAYDEGKMDWS